MKFLASLILTSFLLAYNAQNNDTIKRGNGYNIKQVVATEYLFVKLNKTGIIHGRFKEGSEIHFSYIDANRKLNISEGTITRIKRDSIFTSKSELHLSKLKSINSFSNIMSFDVREEYSTYNLKKINKTGLYAVLGLTITGLIIYETSYDLQRASLGAGMVYGGIITTGISFIAYQIKKSKRKKQELNEPQIIPLGEIEFGTKYSFTTNLK